MGKLMSLRDRLRYYQDRTNTDDYWMLLFLIEFIDTEGLGDEVIRDLNILQGQQQKEQSHG